jgi:hypothetical protein
MLAEFMLRNRSVSVNSSSGFELNRRITPDANEPIQKAKSDRNTAYAD